MMISATPIGAAGFRTRQATSAAARSARCRVDGVSAASPSDPIRLPTTMALRVAAEAGRIGELRSGGGQCVGLVDEQVRGEPAEPRRLVAEARLQRGGVENQPSIDDDDCGEHPERSRTRGEQGERAEVPAPPDIAAAELRPSGARTPVCLIVTPISSPNGTMPSRTGQQSRSASRSTRSRRRTGGDGGHEDLRGRCPGNHRAPTGSGSSAGGTHVGAAVAHLVRALRTGHLHVRQGQPAPTRRGMDRRHARSDRNERSIR